MFMNERNAQIVRIEVERISRLRIMATYGSLAAGLIAGWLVTGQWVWEISASLPVFVLVVTWTQLRKWPTSVEIDSMHHLLVVNYSPLALKRQLRRPLAPDSAVRSYVTGGRFPRNVVELCTTGKGASPVPIGRFEPLLEPAKGFWSTPRFAESVAARHLRSKLNGVAGIRDLGFGAHPGL